MAFFLIVPSVMFLSILLVHGAASHFGLNLKYRALLLCSATAIAISFIAIKTSPFLDKFFFAKLVGLILLASVSATALNMFLIKRTPAPKAEPISIVITPKELEELTAPSNDELPITSSRSLVKLVNDDKKSPSKKFPKHDALPDRSEAPKPSKQSRPIAKPDRTEKNSSTPSEKKLFRPITQTVHAVDKSVPTVDKKIAGLVAANEKISAVIDKSKSDKPKSDRFRADKIEPDKSKSDNTENASTPSTNEPAPHEDELAAVEEHLRSLDTILEFADAQKNSGNLKLAILAYQKALERYRADDYAPFIAIDLSAIYKEQAAYSKAIKVFEDAINLPAVRRNSSARTEFANNLAYLRTVQSVLSKHRVLSTPFSKISRQLRAEIDADFKKQTVFSAV